MTTTTGLSRARRLFQTRDAEAAKEQSPTWASSVQTERPANLSSLTAGATNAFGSGIFGRTRYVDSFIFLSEISINLYYGIATFAKSIQIIKHFH